MMTVRRSTPMLRAKGPSRFSLLDNQRVSQRSRPRTRGGAAKNVIRRNGVASRRSIRTRNPIPWARLLGNLMGGVQWSGQWGLVILAALVMGGWKGIVMLAGWLQTGVILLANFLYSAWFFLIDLLMGVFFFHQPDEREEGDEGYDDEGYDDAGYGEEEDEDDAPLREPAFVDARRIEPDMDDAPLLENEEPELVWGEQIETAKMVSLAVEEKGLAQEQLEDQAGALRLRLTPEPQLP